MPGALHPDFQTEAGDPLWTCCLWPETISEPTAPTAALLGCSTRELLYCPPLLQQKYVLSLPCCIATDSLYIKGGCVSLFSSFLFHAGEKHWPDCPGLYLPACWSDETSPSPCLASAPAPGRTGSSSRAGGAV